jgi:hypothetical protein
VPLGYVSRVSAPSSRRVETNNCTPPRVGAIIVTMLMAFFAGMALGGLLTGSSQRIDACSRQRSGVCDTLSGRHTVDYAVEAQGTRRPLCVESW